ncbi:transposase [Blastopirellula retiformator]|uniref:Transposase IS200 like protein n=1 Tax=Blastopirellula retiformator TaxID=2527970 RepID=A0A5C5V017_9BACT|nr:transposase [Blastopirellula retiformator]TWT31964.1 Transposase IS200 like protein [Blastopirellula retiformator]
MPQSLARIWCHLIFSTKRRQAFFRDEGIRTELHAYLATCLTSSDCEPKIVGGAEDHVHLLFLLSRTTTLADIVAKVKAASSKWLKSKGAGYHDFGWQAGYGVFSVSESKVPDVVDYIRNQVEHHRRFDFQAEFREICRRHGVELDERFVWD